MDLANYLQQFQGTAIQMYLMLCPPSVLAVMLGMLPSSTVAERLYVSKRMCLIGTVLLFTFAFFGDIILDHIFHVKGEAFQVGGGLFLFTVGLKLIGSKREEDPQSGELSKKESAKKSVSSAKSPVNLDSLIITPLATPLLVGPATITATISMRLALPSGLPYKITFFTALGVTMIAVYLTFWFGCKFSKFLTPFVLMIAEKLAGLFLLCISIGSILNGMQKFLATC